MHAPQPAHSPPPFFYEDGRTATWQDRRTFVAAMVAVSLPQPTLLAASSTGGFSNASCEHLNVQRNIDTKREWQVTKAVLCDTQPAACVSEFLFSHEFYWSENQARKNGGIKCARWTWKWR